MQRSIGATRRKVDEGTTKNSIYVLICSMGCGHRSHAMTINPLKVAAINNTPASPTHDLVKTPPMIAPTNNSTAEADLRFLLESSNTPPVSKCTSDIMSHSKLVTTAVGRSLCLNTLLVTTWPAA